MPRTLTENAKYKFFWAPPSYSGKTIFSIKIISGSSLRTNSSTRCFPILILLFAQPLTHFPVRSPKKIPP